MAPRTQKNLKTRLLFILTAPWRWVQRIVCLIGWIVVGLMALMAGALFLFLHDLPRAESMELTQLTQLGSAQVAGRLESPDAHYRWVPLREINRDLLYTIVLAEDAHFFEHQGLNYDAMIDALIANWRRGERAFGGSTITQQVAKNLYLDNRKSYTRKLQEIVIARRLERSLSKNEIVEIYLNIAEFGPDIFGVDAAAKAYFAKSPDAINAAEGAYLALFLPSPRRHYYTLHQNRNRTPAFKRKYEVILRGMAQLGYISPAQYSQYQGLIHQSRWP